MGRGWVLWPTLAICALVLLLLGQQREAVSRGLSSQTESHELAGLWLASHTQPGEAVMVRDSEVAFYADRPLVALPDASWPEILTYARMRDARILVIDDWAVERLRPQLISLLTPDQAPSELQYLTSFTDRNRTTLIYKLLSP